MCNKECLKNTLVAVSSVFVLFFLFFKFGPKIPLSIISQQKGEPLVAVGEGKVTVTPDIAKVILGIEESGTSLKSVQDSVNKKSKSLTDSLKKSGVGDKEIKTTSYNVHPQYDYNSPLQRITGYRVSASYEVTIKDFDKINEILILATQSGANTAGGINFEVNDETKNKKLQEAREEAVTLAKEKAEGLAKAAGISLGKIINISESFADDGIRPIPMYAIKDISAENKAVPANIEPGETEISVTISLSYEIK